MALRVAAAQSASVAGDIPANVRMHLRLASLAAEHDVHLLVFPELSLTGYELDLARAKAVRADGEVLNPLRAFAAEAGMTVVAGAPVPNHRGELYIAALAFRPDRSVLVYTKQQVHESEQHVFTSGPGGPPFVMGDVNVALAICADASHPEHAARAASRGAFIYAAGVMITDDAYPRKTALMEGYAREHGMVVLMANYSGMTGGEQSAGKSAVWSEGGAIVAACRGTEEALVLAEKQNGIWHGTVLAAGSASVSASPRS